MMYIAKIDGKAVHIYEAVTGAYVRVISTGYVPLTAVCQGEILSLRCDDGKTYIFNVRKGEYIRTIC